MNNDVQPLMDSSVLCETPPIVSAQPGLGSRAARLFVFPLKLFWGMIFCQGLVSSIAVTGWSYRMAQRAALKYWWSRSPKGEQSFSTFLNESEETKGHRHWPNWFAQQNFREQLRKPDENTHWQRALRVCAALGHSLSLNFAIGLRGIFNTWVLTLPACLFWWFGWYDGWNNSFSKGYEQAAVGPLISIVGILSFMIAMFYVPLAQARQAVTGEWRSFYNFRLVWSIVRLRWLSSVGLAALYSLVALPLSILKTAPAFHQTRSGLADFTDSQALMYLDSYFFWCALAMLPAYLLLRVVAARIYASGILALVQKSRLKAEKLSHFEAEALERLQLMNAEPRQERHRFLRFIAWTGTRAGRTAGSIALVFIWFTFIVQIYITEFLQYHNGIGWLNQPLVQLPWFHYVPAHLKNPFEAIVSSILFWSAVVMFFWMLRGFRRAK